VIPFLEYASSFKNQQSLFINHQSIPLAAHQAASVAARAFPAEAGTPNDTIGGSMVIVRTALARVPAAIHRRST